MVSWPSERASSSEDGITSGSRGRGIDVVVAGFGIGLTTGEPVKGLNPSSYDILGGRGGVTGNDKSCCLNLFLKTVLRMSR